MSIATFKFRKYDVNVGHTFFLTLLHVYGAYGLYLWLSQDRDAIIKSLYMVTIVHCICLLGITAGYHRLWSHRTYDAKEPFRWLVMTMSSLAFQGSIFTWARDHRLHHKYSDTQLDPHSMDNGFFFAHMGWTLC
jgi:stearoyl-CoA desaturase (Delta-9 desaturase)